MAAKKETVKTQRSKALNPDGATTLNIPCFNPEKALWKKAAQGKGLLTASWARMVLNEAIAKSKG